MARLELASDKCLSADIGNTRYEAGGTGYVEVNRPEHIAIAKQTGLRFYGRQYSFNGASVECQDCGFEQLACFTGRPCPKCGAAFVKGGHDG